MQFPQKVVEEQRSFARYIEDQKLMVTFRKDPCKNCLILAERLKFTKDKFMAPKTE